MIWHYYRSSVKPGTIITQRKTVRAFCHEIGIGYPTDGAQEIISGLVPWRERGLKRVIESMRKGDILVAVELSRLSRDFYELGELANIILTKGATVRFSRNPDFILERTPQSVCMWSQMAINAQLEINLISKRTKDSAHKRKKTPQRVRLEQHAEEIRVAFYNCKTVAELARHYRVDKKTMKNFIVNVLEIDVERYLYGHELVPKIKNDHIRNREEALRWAMKIDPYEEPERWKKYRGPLPWDVQVSMKIGTFPKRFWYPQIEPFLTDVDIMMKTGIISRALEELKKISLLIDDDVDRETRNLLLEQFIKGTKK